MLDGLIGTKCSKKFKLKKREKLQYFSVDHLNWAKFSNSNAMSLDLITARKIFRGRKKNFNIFCTHHARLIYHRLLYIVVVFYLFDSIKAIIDIYQWWHRWCKSLLYIMYSLHLYRVSNIKVCLLKGQKTCKTNSYFQEIFWY